MRSFPPKTGILWILLSFLCFVPTGMTGYWEDQFDLPPLLESEPDQTPLPDFTEEGFHLLSVSEILTDLGRRQTLEIDRLQQESNLRVGCYSMDRVAQEWTRKYIQDFRHDKSVTLPIFSVVDEGLRGLFRGYDTNRMRVFPHTLIFDASRAIQHIFQGVQSKEILEEGIEAAMDPWLGIEPSQVQVSGSNQIQNGDFETLTPEGVPEAWGVYQADLETCLGSPKTGWNGSHTLEIRSSPDRDYQIAYQIIPHQALLGKRVMLSGLAQANSLGVPRAALAIPHPKIEEGFDFIPRAPIQTRTGKGIPLRILGSLEFGTGHSQWQHLACEIEVPTDSQALVLLLYLDNPSATGGAARFEAMRLTLQ